ncbi:hypothetical protein ARMSODRAFT_977229 [Armillaria solidipes]|uniref:Uncharacterized protein n=1 Tax=Armillaria solidipes TaxID=1076256 RepID=A0A2H3B705_9AGAR|nr:hypothetical protein ARMSODRAFT_977229 [Armillaria solidipes]
MVHPGTFQGKRKHFLMDEQEGYAQAVQEDRAAEQIADVFHNVEPSDEDLAKIDDSALDPEPVVPDESSLPPDQYAKIVAEIEAEGALLIYRLNQIHCWLRYQYSKMHDLSAKESGKENPYTVMLHRLTGLSISKPRKSLIRGPRVHT